MNVPPTHGPNGHQPGEQALPLAHEATPSPERVREVASVVLAAEIVAWLYRDALKELSD